MVRAVPAEVQKLVDNTTDNVDLYVSMANVMVDELLLTKGLSDAALALIETLLAAHFALLSIEHGALAEKTIGEAKEKYHNVYRAGLNSTRFGQQAIAVDSTGSLAAASAQAEKSTTKKALFSVVTSTAPETEL